MRFRTASRIFLYVSAVALTVTGASVTAQASTSTANRLTADVGSVLLNPGEIVGCRSPVDPPFFLTSRKTTLYSSAKITWCTTPRPQECRLTIITEELGQFGVWIELPGGMTKGFTTKCVGLSVRTKGYKCRPTLVKHRFRTLEELQIMYRGRIATGVRDSTVIAEYC